MQKKKPNPYAQALGRLGAKARAKKFKHADFVRWGEMGRGKPKSKK